MHSKTMALSLILRNIEELSRTETKTHYLHIFRDIPAWVLLICTIMHFLTLFYTFQVNSEVTLR